GEEGKDEAVNGDQAPGGREEHPWNGTAADPCLSHPGMPPFLEAAGEPGGEPEDAQLLGGHPAESEVPQVAGTAKTARGPLKRRDKLCALLAVPVVREEPRSGEEQRGP